MKKRRIISMHTKSFCLFLVLFANVHSIELSYGIGGGIIGDGDLHVGCGELGIRSSFFNHFFWQSVIAVTMGDRTKNISDQTSIMLDRDLLVFDNFYSVQCDISAGLQLPKYMSLKCYLFGGITPTYQSQIGADWYLSAHPNVPGGIVAWDDAYWKNSGLSLAYHYGVGLGFEGHRFFYGLKGIYRSNTDNTWGIAMVEFGFKFSLNGSPSEKGVAQ